MRLDHASYLSADGLLARHIEGFSPRLAQQEMAEAVAEAMEHHHVLITEAGTGTGKTYAYLVPALLSGKKTILSTGTKTLQDQLYHRDLPMVRKALGVGSRVALLKGRANYLCLHRMQAAYLDAHPAAQAQALRGMEAWSRQTRSGDIAEFKDIPEDHPVWPSVTSTAENCLGQDCPQYNECFVLKARRAAQEADIVVVNHHLLLADMALKEEGFGELLPGAEAFVLDEAHQLPEIAGQFFGVTLSSRQLLELARDVKVEQAREAGDMPDLPAAADTLEKAALDMRLAFGVQPRRAALREVAKLPAMKKECERLKEALEHLQDFLEPAAVRGKGLENCWQRCISLSERFRVLTEEKNDNSVRWFETYTRSFVIHSTPLHIAPHFHAHMQRYEAAWMFTSATLAVNGRFTHFASQLGLNDPVTSRWDSPFDYAKHALLYVPKAMPMPDEAHYTESVIKAALPVLQASEGRAFLLFTSHRALKQAAQMLENKLPYPLLIQGSVPRNELLERFRNLGNAVLLGTGSFWEGVDVRGPALSCVIIDKLPFAAPDDPVLQARLEAMRDEGANPFMEHQIPQAVIALKQGVGRLIRDERDRGVMMICDPRLYAKSYGRIFLDSLPPMTRTRELADVQRFFARELAVGFDAALVSELQS